MRDVPAGQIEGFRRFGPFLLVQHSYPAAALKEWHSHPWLHLAIVQEGSYSRIERSRRHEFRPGSLSFLRCEERHIDDYAAGSRCLHVVIPPEMEQRLSQDFRTGVAAGEIMHEVAAPASIALQREFLLPKSSSAFVIEALLLDLVSRHLEIVCERSVLRPAWMGSLLEYLNDTFEEQWTLDGIASDLGIHPVHLCRAFSEFQGCTLGAYIRNLRIARGRQLLALSRSSLTDVAARCGFCDQSHFTRAFKRRFGTTPGAFRESIVPNRSQS